RDEVEALHEHQKTLPPEEIAKEQAQLLSGATPASVAAPAPDPQAEPETQPAPPPPSDTPIPPPPTDPSGPSANGGQPKPSLAEALSSEAVTKALNSDVPPRDAAERVTFATWAIVTGKSAGGIFNPLPKLDADTAAKMAQRLSERADGPITVEDVQAAETIEALAERVRTYLEAGQIDGFVRTLRARPEGSTKIPVFVFHPAGGSTVVYEPLLKRLPPDTPMYGFERVEGSVQERAAQYVPKLLELNGDNPFVLVGWSLGGALAYACAIGLKRAGADVRFVGLIDTVRAGEEIPQTKEETRKRWDRYARFAERTFNVEIPAIPYEQLEELDDEGQVKFVLDIVQQSGVQIPGGIVEHQRTSYLDNRALETVQIEPYDGHVTLYMADRYHDDVIEFEPRYAIRQPDGGWGEYVADLEVVPIGGEHIQVIDEPIIGKVGAHLTDVLNKVEAQTSQTSEVGK
ncbi:thioesterase domain-containing protein, partial [Mycobacterium avium]|uniref:thioesterase domain-containing protein n=1 Tax=Mycobacterium avium TaxID=1764 RepID=UPI000AB16956